MLGHEEVWEGSVAGRKLAELTTPATTCCCLGSTVEDVAATSGGVGGGLWIWLYRMMLLLALPFVVDSSENLNRGMTLLWHSPGFHL